MQTTLPPAPAAPRYNDTSGHGIRSLLPNTQRSPKPSPHSRSASSAWLVLGMALMAVFALSQPVCGQAFSENFESYGPGSNIHGQGGWTGWAGNPAAGATVSTMQSLSPTRSLRVQGANHPVRGVNGVTSGIWTFSVQQRIQTGSTGTTMLGIASRYRPR